MTKEQAISYGSAATTGGGSFAFRMMNDLSQMSAMELLTAVGITIGIIGAVVRVYVDISAHKARKRAEKAEV